MQDTDHAVFFARNALKQIFSTKPEALSTAQANRSGLLSAEQAFSILRPAFRGAERAAFDRSPSWRVRPSDHNAQNEFYLVSVGGPTFRRVRIAACYHDTTFATSFVTLRNYSAPANSLFLLFEHATEEPLFVDHNSLFFKDQLFVSSPSSPTGAAPIPTSSGGKNRWSEFHHLILAPMPPHDLITLIENLASFLQTDFTALFNKSLDPWFVATASNFLMQQFPEFEIIREPSRRGTTKYSLRRTRLREQWQEIQALTISRDHITWNPFKYAYLSPLEADTRKLTAKNGTAVIVNRDTAANKDKEEANKDKEETTTTVNNDDNDNPERCYSARRTWASECIWSARAIDTTLKPMLMSALEHAVYIMLHARDLDGSAPMTRSSALSYSGE